MAKPPSARKHAFRPAPQSARQRLWGKDTLLVERMSQEGRGIATRLGKVVFVSGALPGERVRVQCTAVKRDYDEADMLELADGARAAASRVDAGCPIYHQCGGCSLQHWSPAAQERHKQANLLAMLQAVSPGLALESPIASRADGFRHRLRLAVTRNPDKTWRLGMRQRRSRESVAVKNCLVANSAVNDFLPLLSARLSSVPQLQGLREIEVDGDSEDQIGLCCYFAARPRADDLAALGHALLTAPVTALRVRVAVSKHNRRDDPWSGEPGDGNTTSWEEVYATGELSLRLVVPGPVDDAARPALQLGYLPGDFTQTNWAVNAALVARAMDWLQPGREEEGLDLFSGMGNFTLPLAQRVKAVHALEGDSGMTQRVTSNAQRNGLDNIRARTLDLLEDETTLPPADIAIIDPPRSGARAVCAGLTRSNVQRLVYISCHPATLVRDARLLQKAGFSLVRAAAVDMFPHTGHSEAIVLFRKKGPRVL